MVANLTVDRLPEGAAWDNVLYDSPSLGYVVATHQNLRMTTGRSVLTYYLPLAAANPATARAWMLEREWRDWVSLILADLGQAHPGIESTRDARRRHAVGPRDDSSRSPASRGARRAGRRRRPTARSASRTPT